jgi:hypothetical protein
MRGMRGMQGMFSRTAREWRNPQGMQGMRGIALIPTRANCQNVETDMSMGKMAESPSIA